jgi:hypothetical protein
MVVADLAIDKDNTVSVYCERDQTAKVEAMFNPPAPAPVPLTEPELRAVLTKTNRMITNAMCGPFWPELEQACRAIEAAHGITGKGQP